jgi:glyoxylase-like metal-dependent hydrolase (beta-lactamase superfamily II)
MTTHPSRQKASPGRAARIKRGLLVLALSLVVVLSAGYFWLLGDGGAFSSADYALDVAAVRQAAASINGARATDIQIETISHTDVPEAVMVAGTGWQRVDLVRVGYHLVFPDQSIIIDTAYDAETARQGGADRYDNAAWRRLQDAMRSASHIVVTHEHADHIGGLLASPYWPELLPKALVTQEQFDNPQGAWPAVWPEGSREWFKPLRYDALLAIAPGVVLIKAPGHSPGSQMIYVQRADGQEYLFMGDVASMLDNVARVSIRSRLVTNFISHDDRAEVVAETKALHRLAAAEPNIALVPGHDGAALTALADKKLLTVGFTP